MHASRPARHRFTPLFWSNMLNLTTHFSLFAALLQGGTIAPPIAVSLLSACLTGDVYLAVLLSRRRRFGP